MQTTPVADPRAWQGRHPGPPRPTPRRDAGAMPAGSDRLFLVLLDAYRPSGGLARAAEVVTALERRRGLDADLLARWRAERRVVCFDWQSLTWLPRFQFEFVPAGPLPAPVLAAVLSELGTAGDGWAVALWFVRPHAALDGRAPVEVIGDAHAAVLHAARGDRFAAEG